jgi:hypothetical protein
MPNLVNRLPVKRTETFEQAFGRMRKAAIRSRIACWKSSSVIGVPSGPRGL